MKQFFITIKDSVYNPKFYQELLKTPAGASFKYFFLFILCFAIVSTIFVAAQTLPGLQKNLNLLVNKGLDLYPQELVVTFKDGMASTNVAEPYVIKMPGDLAGKTTSAEMPENLLVIDTKNNARSYSLEALREYKTVALLTKDSFVAARNPNEIRVFSLKTVPNAEITKEKIVTQANRFRPYLKYFGPVIVGFMLIFIYIGGLFKLAYLLVGALLIWAATAIMKIKTGYAKSFQIGLHAITLGTILQILFHLLPGRVPSIPFAYTILMLLVVVVNLRQTSKA